MCIRDRLEAIDQSACLLMGSILREAALLQESLKRFVARLSAEGIDAPSTTSCCEHLLVALQSDFDPDQHALRGVKRADSKRFTAVGDSQQLKRHATYEHNRRLEAEKQLEELRANKINGRIRALWFVRIALAPPTLPMRTLADVCRDFCVEETQQASFTYIGTVRDAFAEIIKSLNKQVLSSRIASLKVADSECASSSVFITH
eukprot:2791441-Karenia_brevis.AAC.1